MGQNMGLDVGRYRGLMDGAEDAVPCGGRWRERRILASMPVQTFDLHRMQDAAKDTGPCRGCWTLQRRWYSDKTLDRKLDAAEVAAEDAEQDAGSYS